HRQHQQGALGNAAQVLSGALLVDEEGGEGQQVDRGQVEKGGLVHPPSLAVRGRAFTPAPTVRAPARARRWPGRPGPSARRAAPASWRWSGSGPAGSSSSTPGPYGP